MPELPEVETTIKGIKPFVLGQKVSQVIIRNAQLRFPIPKLLNKKLIGHRVNKISRRAKYMLFHFDHGILIIHLGMSGRLSILSTSNRTSFTKHDHIDILFANHTGLRLRDPRRFGVVLWSDDTHAETSHRLLKHLGKEPLSLAFNGQYLYQRAQHRKIAVKSFIMDSKIVVGVGNIYATESLFAAKINPSRAAGDLSKTEWEILAQQIKKVLKAALKAGGTTLKDFAGPKGDLGYFAVQLNVYGRAGLPCVCCKAILKSKRINQRSTVYCAYCQTDARSGM